MFVALATLCSALSLDGHCAPAGACTACESAHVQRGEASATLDDAPRACCPAAHVSAACATTSSARPRSQKERGSRRRARHPQDRCRGPCPSRAHSQMLRVPPSSPPLASSRLLEGRRQHHHDDGPLGATGPGAGRPARARSLPSAHRRAVAGTVHTAHAAHRLLAAAAAAAATRAS